MLCYTILYYTILYYTILYYTILYYTILPVEEGRLEREGVVREGGALAEHDLLRELRTLAQHPGDEFAPCFMYDVCVRNIYIYIYIYVYI